jgi:hypothetical protein
MTTETTPTIRILVSSPGDVAVERDKARKVVEGLRKRYAGRLRLETVLWEDLPLGAVDSFQGGIDVVLQGPKAIDIAVFILWSRLGSPLGTAICRPDGMPYRSGTEREFDLMLSARAQSRDDRPEILVYVRQDDCGFKAVLLRAPTDEIEDMLRQHRLAELFIREQFLPGTQLVRRTAQGAPAGTARPHRHGRRVWVRFLGGGPLPRTGCFPG